MMSCTAVRSNGWTIAIATSLIAGTLLLGTATATPVTHPLTVAVSQPATTINEKQIRQIVDQMQAASNQKDTQTIMKFLAPNAVLQMTITAQGKPQTMNLTRAQYYQYLQQGFYITESYSGKYSDLKIQIAPNRKTAIATYVLDEELTLKNQPGTLVSSSDTWMKFELVKGNILITLLKTNSRLSIKQG